MYLKLTSFLRFCLLLTPSLMLGQTMPVANFGITETKGCAPLTTSFANNSQNADSYQWSFPGGSPATSTAAEPTVIFPTPGNFPVLLIAINAFGNDTAGFNITVFNPPPVADFDFQLSDHTASFNNQSEGASFYVWEFGDGQSSTAENPVHIYENDGIFLVRLTVINDCASRKYTDVVVINNGIIIPEYTANDQIPNTPTRFLPGVNLGYSPPWSDSQLADIAAGNPAEAVEGVGVKTIRVLLPDYFLEQWGYDIRIDAFDHYHDLKLKDNTAIIGFPSEEHRDTTHYCTAHQSEMFANLYAPIWDNGENGTPVNDDNHLAIYLWRMVHLYGQDIKFWEVWNEPGFDYTFLTGFLDPGFAGNWWENNPDPCDYKLRAPIYHYIRTLRISYEVIKAIKPDAHITLASVGYPSFMDAILRNTDNPEDGSANVPYPYGGGAYFDAVTIHSYPHFDGSMRYWDESTMSFVNERHTDKAAAGIARTKGLYQNVLASYGYDGVTYPQKKWIITEIAVPRKPFGDYFGSDEIQINYMIKSYVEAVKNNIEAFHIYDMAESHFYDDAVSEFQTMGLFQRLFGVLPYNQIKNNQATALKTTSDLLYTATYDPQREAAMNLPAGVSGSAFLNPDGHYHYLLWATTSLDNSESASATYSFPDNFNITQLEKRNWDFSDNGQIEIVNGNNIELDGRPVFFTDLNNTIPIPPTADFSVTEAAGCTPMTITFNDASTTNTTAWNWSFPGGEPTTSTAQNPSVVYNEPGTYTVSLETVNATGSDFITFDDLIVVDEILPEAAFDIEINGQIVSFVNSSIGATDYYWDLGDGNTSTSANPTNDYNIASFYNVLLIARNGCGSDTLIQEIIIGPDEILPRPDFSADQQVGCGPLTVQFMDQSSENTTGWWWQFQGGTPNFSSEQNPLVTYDNTGSFFVKLIASTAAGEMTIFRASYIEVTGEAPQAIYTFGISGLNLFLFNNSIDANSYLWLFDDGQMSTEVSPSHTYAEPGIYEVSLVTTNSCGTDTLTTTMNVLSTPTADFSANQTQGCVADTINFTSLASSNTLDWNWVFTGGEPASSTDQNPSVIYPTAGGYDVTLAVTNEEGNDILVRSNFINIAPDPVAGFNFSTIETVVSFTNIGTSADSYFWDFGDGNSSELENPVHDYGTGGTYTAKLRTTQDCGMDSTEQEILIISTGVRLPVAVTDWNLFPNPNNGQFSIHLSGQSAGHVQLEVLNMLGQSILKEQHSFQSGQLMLQVNQQKWPTGTYWVVVRSEEWIMVDKMIVSDQR